MYLKIKGSKYANYKGNKWEGNTITEQRQAIKRLKKKKNKMVDLSNIKI